MVYFLFTLIVYLLHHGTWNVYSSIVFTAVEKADDEAKLAVSLPITNMLLPAYDLIPRVSKFWFEERQDIWNCWIDSTTSLYMSVSVTYT